MTSSQEIFSSNEFDTWAHGEGLLAEEKYLIEKYLSKDKKTIEAGTGGGRILLSMKKLGFTFLQGYDFLPKFIEQARQKDPNSSICFEVENAIALSYEDCSFKQILYLQQIICSIEKEEERLKAVKEAYRILQNGGIALFSFLSFEARSRKPMYIMYLAYLTVVRGVLRRKRKRSIQELPYLKHGGKPNFFALLDHAPYLYWYKTEEAHQLLKQAGFEIVAIGSDYQISQGKMHISPETLKNEPTQEIMYFVCKK
ncbi:MAG: class I SAM-dependent methyltransferase [Goleter apudmare HA4340-LM2]|jgi:ubiquinone/menaquinone biosynthesis C-methylase UbiE|nr:class I SAM-dependent methyltransferase [Goleter apudmare HA4340-LM2]